MAERWREISSFPASWNIEVSLVRQALLSLSQPTFASPYKRLCNSLISEKG